MNAILWHTYPLAAATTNMPIRLKATMPAAFPSRRTLACNLTTGHLDPDTAGEAIWPTPPRSQSALPWGRPRPPCPPGEPLPLPRAPRAGGEGAELWAGQPSVGRPMMWLMSLASCTPRPLSQEDLDPKVKWQYSIHSFLQLHTVVSEISKSTRSLLWTWH